MDIYNKTTRGDKKVISKNNEAAKKFPILSLQAEKRAHSIVLKCIETTYSEQILSELFKYIKPEHFEDICKERAISGICGYPICNEDYQDNFGKNTFIIRHNNVYNIEKRRNFCSNACYEGSEIVLKQISLTPLYLRDDESDLPSVKVPFPDELKGTHGELVNIKGSSVYSDDLLKDNKNINKEKKSCIIDEIAQESLVKCSENSQENETSDKKKVRTLKVKQKNNPKPTNKCDVNKLAEELNNLTIDTDLLGENNVPYEHRSLPDNEHTDDMHKTYVMDKINDMITKDKGGKKSENQTTDSALVKEGEQNIQNKSQSLDLIYQIERTLREWMTFDSLREILGDKYVRGMLEHIQEDWDNYDTTNDLHLSSNARLKYITLCRQLNAEEEEEQNMEEAELRAENGDKPTELLPDYQQLKKDLELQTLKVKAFLAGETEYTVDEENSSHKLLDDNLKKKQLKIIERNVSSEGATSSLPLIDEYSQQRWRQNIVMEKIDTVLGDLVLLLNLSEKDIRHLVLQLVSTFELSRDNISFKPIQWIIITLTIIKMLSVRYTAITCAMKEESAVAYVSSIFKGFGLDAHYLDRLLGYVTEIQYILAKVNKTRQKEGLEEKEIMSNEEQTEILSKDNYKSSVLEELD